MNPLGAEATDAVLTWGDGLHRSVALHHAAIHGRPGLWGDDRLRPSSAIWLRDGGDQWEAFGAGSAGPALEWLERAALGRSVVLAAPPSWEEIVRERVGRFTPIERSRVQTRLRPEAFADPMISAAVRPLVDGDAAAFQDVAPAWALGSWGDFATLIDRGSAWGVAGRSGLAAVAWVVEADHDRAKVGVATDPRFRRLGLGRAVASALIRQIEQEQRKLPLWVVNPANTASVALARSLGFATQVTETLVRWTP